FSRFALTADGDVRAPRAPGRSFQRDYCFATSTASTFSLFEIFTGAPFFVASFTFFMLQLRAYSIDPASAPCAVMFAKLTLMIGFSGKPLAEKIRRAFVISTFSILMFRNSQKPRSGGVTGVLRAIQCGGVFVASFGIVA